MAKRLYELGTDVLYQDNIKYRIIHETEKLKENGKWIVQYGACRLKWNGQPDRRYLSVPGPDDHCGRFKVFIIREDYILKSLKVIKMKKYIGTKTIEATPMNLGDYNDYRKWTIPANEDPKREGYLVKYPDGYESWSPKDVFDASYHELLFEYYPLPDDADQVEHRLPDRVFPSEVRSVAVAPDADYGGAHRYQFQESLGFNKGGAEYADSFQEIHFVQKNLDGSMTPGLQSEQLLIALIDRHKKLNAKFPSREGSLAITKMEEALQWLRARVEERINRGVMGDLKK